jgi:glycosyltransferase involved in cell wall biosynthesis
VTAPKVSVVIPVYDGEAFVGEAIDSALSQSFRDLEVIVVDDGSRDRSLAVAREREQDPRVRVIAAPHRGLSQTRNHALREAKGRFVAFLDADDLWEPGYLAAQVAALEADPTRFVYADGVRFGDGPDLPFYGPGYAPAETFRDLYRPGHVASPSAVLAPLDAVRAAGGFPESDGPIVEDLGLWLALAARGARPSFNPAARIRYRLHPGQLTRDWVRHHRGRIAVRLLHRDDVGGDPPARLVPAAEADAVIARCGLDLAVALASQDPAGAARAAGEALARDSTVRDDPRWRKWRRKARRARIRRIPVLGPLLARLRRGGSAGRAG